MSINDRVWEALREGPQTCKELQEALGLKAYQVRHNVWVLRRKGWRVTRGQKNSDPYTMHYSLGCTIPSKSYVNHESLLEVIREGPNRADVLADRFGVSVDAIRRVITDLRAEGFPIVNTNSERWEESEPEPMPRYEMMGAKLNPKGRVCRFEGCKTVLSVYNDAELCSIHEREE